jgi:hypothetical protein
MRFTSMELQGFFRDNVGLEDGRLTDHKGDRPSRVSEA